MKFILAIQRFLNALSQFALSCCKIVFLSKWNTKLPKATGKSIAVLANGPSLQEGLAKLKADGMSENIIVSNFFCQTALYEELKPNYYLICDDIFAHLSEEYPNVEQFYKDLYRKTTWDLVFFIPARFHKRIMKLVADLELSNPKIRYYSYNNVNFNGDYQLNYFLFKTRLGMPRPTTVAVPALMQCIHLGFKNISLVGIDLNQHLDLYMNEDNVMYLKVKHFYSGEEPVLTPYFKNKKKNIAYSSSEMFLIFHYFFYSFDIIAKFAAKRNVEIINYSRESFLDQFKK